MWVYLHDIIGDVEHGLEARGKFNRTHYVIVQVCYVFTQKYLQVEDEHEQEKQEILKSLEKEKHERRLLDCKVKTLSDHGESIKSNAQK